MNARCFKTVFSEHLGCLVAVGEHACSQGKSSGESPAGLVAAGVGRSVAGVFIGALVLSLAWVGLAWAQVATSALPTAGQVVQGSASMAQSANQLHIAQATQRAAINWQSFDIGAAAKVNVVQPNAQAVLLNRVVGQSPSQIFGQLQANGHVILVNPNGVLFGKDGSVNAGSFTASTLGISDADFMAGNMLYQRNGSTAGVVNQGTIAVTPGGYVALLGASVSNEGKIIAPQGGVASKGGVALGAAETIKVPVSGSGRIKLELTAGDINASVRNTGQIVSEGGQVYMQALALNRAAAQVIQSGSIDTTGEQGGAVHLLADGGIVKVDGSIKANSTGTDDKGQVRKGGDIVIGRDEETGVLAAATNVSGAQLESNKGFVETSGDWLATYGTRVLAKDWLLDPTNITIAASGASGTAYSSNYTAGADSVILASDISASLTAGTSVTLATSSSGGSAGDINVNASIAKTDGADATLTLKAHNDIIVAANTTITSTVGKLNVVLNSDLDSGGSGAIVMMTGSGITSNGGYITLGGGTAGTGAQYAIGNSVNPNGVLLDGVSLLSGGGNITLRGKSTSDGTLFDFRANGIRLRDASSNNVINAGSGQIAMDGWSVSTGSDTGYGIEISQYNTSAYSTQLISSNSSSAIWLGGAGSTASSVLNRSGVYINTKSTVSATGNGGVTIVATSGGLGEAFNIRDGATINTSTANASVTVTADSMSIAATAIVNAGAGTVTLQNKTAGTLINVGGGDVLTGSPLTLGISNAELNRITAGTTKVGSTTAGALTVSTALTTAAATGNLYLQSGGTASISNSAPITSGAGLFIQTTGGQITQGTSSALSGTHIALENTNGTINTTTGVITKGAGTGASGVTGIVANSNITATGNLHIYGLSNSVGVNLAQGVHSGSNIQVTGQSSGSNGITIGSNVSVMTTGSSGNSLMTAIASATNGGGGGAFHVSSGASFNAATGSTLTLDGQATGAAASASLNTRGMRIDGGATVDGAITIKGSSKSADGLMLINGRVTAAANSVLSLFGTTAGNGGAATGLVMANSGGVALNNGASLAVTGQAANTGTPSSAETAVNISGSGIAYAAGATASGNITITGTTTSVTNSNGVYLGGGVYTNGGNITVSAQNPAGSSGYGVSVAGAVNASGNITIQTPGSSITQTAGTMTARNVSVDATNGTVDAVTGVITAGAATTSTANGTPVKLASTAGVGISASGNINIMSASASTQNAVEINGVTTMNAGGTAIASVTGEIKATSASSVINVTGNKTVNNTAMLTTTTTGASINLTSTAGGITGSGGIGSTTYKSASVTFSSATASTYSGAINETNFTKAGAGSLTLASWVNMPFSAQTPAQTASLPTNISNAYTVKGGGELILSPGAAYAQLNPASVNVENASTFSINTAGNGYWKNTAFNFTGGSGGGTMNLGGNPIGDVGTTNTFSTSGGASNTITGLLNANSANVNFNLTSATSGTALVDGSFAAIAFTQNTQGGYGLQNAGTVNVAGGGSLLFKDKFGTTNLNINAGTIQMGDGTAATTAATADLNVTNVAIAGGAKLIFNRAEAYSSASTITGAGRLIQAGSGALTLTGNSSVFAGATTVNAGKTLAIGTGGSLGAAGSTLTLTDASSNLSFTNTSGVSTVASTISGLGSVTENGTGGTGLLLANNTYSGTTTTTAGTLQVGNGGAVGSLGTGAVVDNSALLFNRSDNITVSNLISGTGTLTQAGAGTVLLTNNNTYTGQTYVNAGTLSLGTTATTGIANPQHYSSQFNIAAGATLDFNAAAGVTLDNRGTTFTGAGTITKTGAGSLRWNVVGDTNFNMLAGSLIDVKEGTFTGSTSYHGKWVNNLSSLNVASGASFQGSEGDIRVDALTGAGSVSSGWSTVGSLTVGVNNTAAGTYNTTAGTATFSGALSGPAPFNKIGSGTQILTGANTYTGATNINAGVLQVGDGGTSGTLGTGAVTNSTSLVFNRSDAALIVGAVISGTGTMTQAGTGTTTLSANNTSYSGATTINAGTLQVGNGANTGTLGTSAVSVVAGANLSFYRSDASLSIANNISGAGSVNLKGTGVASQSSYALTGSNSALTGAVNVSLARLALTGGTQVGTAAITVNSGASVWANGNFTINNTLSLAGNGWNETGYGQLGALRLQNGTNYAGEITLAADARIGAYGSTGTVSGVIGGAKNLDFNSGSGTVTLTGNNTYTGTTTISGGTLQVGNAGTTGTLGVGDVTLSNSANLKYVRAAATAIANNISGSGNVSATITGASSTLTVDHTINLTGGTVNLVTDGNLSVTQTINTTNATASAAFLESGKATAASTASGGDVSLSGSGAVTVGSGGRITYMTGSIAGSTGLGVVAGNSRYKSDETTTNYTTALGSGAYAIYREAPTLTATFNNASKTYNGLSYSGGNGVALTGFVNGDTDAQLGTITYSSTSQTAINAGSYSLSGTATSGVGYSLAYTAGTLTVNKAALTVTANADARFVTQPDAAGFNGVSYAGFVGGENSSVLGGALAMSRTNALTNQSAGTYRGVLVASGLTSGNYDIRYTHGDYTIVPANQLLIKTANTSVTYGSTPTLNTTAQYLLDDGVHPSQVVTLTRTGSNGNYSFSDGVGGSVSMVLKPYVINTSTAAAVSTSAHTVVGNYDIKDVSPTVVGSNFVGAPVFVGALTVDTKAVTPSATGVSKVYDASTSMNNVVIGLTGQVASDNLTISGTGAFSQKNVGTGLGYTVSGITLNGNDAANYHLSGGSNSLSGNDGVITAAVLKLTTSDVSKNYDRSLSAQGTAQATQDTQLFGSDTLSGGSFAFTNWNAGNGNKVVTVSGVTVNDGNNGANYNVSYVDNTTSTITPKSLTASYIAASKIYNGSMAATVTGSSSDIIGGDTVNFSNTSANFGSKDVGIGKTVTVAGIGIGGADSGNYALQNTSASTTADIAQAALTVTASAVTKTYDGTLSATGTGTAGALAGAGDVVGSAGSQAFLDKNAGTGKTVRASGVTIKDASNADMTANYAITYVDNTSSVIQQAALTVTVNNTAMFVTQDPNTAFDQGFGFTGLQNGESGASVLGALTRSYTGAANPATGPYASVYGLSATPVAANYTVTVQKGDLNVVAADKLLINVGGKSENYGVLTAANAGASANTVVAQYCLVSTHCNGANLANLTMSHQAGRWTATDVSNSTISFNTVVDTAGRISGGGYLNAGNYTYATDGLTTSGAVNFNGTVVSGGVLSVDAKQLTLSASNVSKVYDGTVALAGMALTPSGVLAGDSVGVTSSGGTFSSKNAGSQTFSLTGLQLQGSDRANYVFAGNSLSGTGTITPKTLSVTASALDKTYDGTTAAAGSLSTANVIGQDDVRLSWGPVAFASKDVSRDAQGQVQSQTVNFSAVQLAGADAGNYSVETTASGSATITPKLLSVSGTSVANKTEDGNTLAMATTGSLSGFIGSETLQAMTLASFDTASIGGNKPVNVRYSLSGGSNGGLAGNYELPMQVLSASILAKSTGGVVQPNPVQSVVAPVAAKSSSKVSRDGTHASASVATAVGQLSSTAEVSDECSPLNFEKCQCVPTSMSGVEVCMVPAGTSQRLRSEPARFSSAVERP